MNIGVSVLVPTILAVLGFIAFLLLSFMIVMRRRKKEEEPQNMVIMSPVPEEAGIVEEGIADESGDASLSESPSELASSTAIEFEAESSPDSAA
jgi:flagellar biosynthesis/type III secretory pathway M-ring protein FliF/YscJ